MLEPLRLWWQKRTLEEDTPFDGDAPAWVFSTVIHLALLIILAAIGLSIASDRTTLVLSTVTEEEVELQVPDEFYFSEQMTEEIGANSVAGEQAALAMAAVKSDISDVPTPEIESEVGNLVVVSPTMVASGPNVSNMAVRGAAAGVGSTGAAGAIDRITHEILLSLEQRKTLVVWLFDKSGSLQRQRDGVNERFDRVYHELGVIEASGNPAFAKHEDKPLLTSVIAFGNEVQWLTPQPTDNLDEIQAAVAAIKNDPTGVERTFSAVYEAAKKNLTYRMEDSKNRRNVMIVVFTDEAGDDQSGLDPTVVMCRRYQIPVYVVGVPAPFGRQEVDIKYVDPDPEFDQTPQWIAVRQGPESLRPEAIKLKFNDSNDDPIDSGFGPYSLTRLCYETGGIYFAVHPNRDPGKAVSKRETAELSAHLTHFFEPAIMRAYQPDYVRQDEYEKLLRGNKARMSLVAAAELSWATPMSEPRLSFPKASEAALVNALSAAQQEAAKLEPKVDRIHAALAVGEKDRATLTEPRWKAGYDLAMGRALAVVVRTKGYNAMLAQAKQGMKFQDEKNDTWVLKPSDKISSGSVLEKQGAAAKTYLERCAAEHEGTPWGMLAQRELQQPLGWEWTETYTGVNEPRMGGGGGNPDPADDMRRMMQKPKPVRKPKL